MTAQRGVVVWFTGLPASGKSTLATRVRARIGDCIVLDSDAVRDVLGAGDYTRTDRDAFYRTLVQLADLFARQGFVVLVAATAPRRAYRDAARALVPGFVEVHVQTAREICERRDIKGLYARARAGDAPTLPGMGELYEPPLSPEVVATGGEDDAAVMAIVQRIVQHQVRTREPV
ncbi:MAG TPA: adenylyl-sulfate kinase [Kofleriaceae bacterium]|jgi:adenylylsulfate kinase|nr:adenylyl-sulfate kinase [Kofleriaceae bacterium]